MRRYLPRLVLAGALLSPATLYALGLGEIRLHSALNQPFDAEIELISPSPDELTSLKVGLAGADMFARYNLERPAFLNGFEFEIRRGSDGRPVIHVSSNRSITEPYVTMLVEARWARGRLLREYTVLLDPPVFMPAESQAQAPVTAPEAGAQSGRIERAPEPAPAATPAPQPEAQSEPEPAVTGSTQPSEQELTPASIGGEYVVERNDTLWSIASRITPGGPRTINRTMIALFRANPSAFNGNINRLRSGAVLRIPDLAEIEAISTAEANAEVARQAAEWSGAQETQLAEESSRLRLVTPAETPTAPSAASTPSEPSTEPAATAAAPAAPTGTQDDRLAVPSPGLAEAQQAVSEAPIEPAPEAQPAPEEAVAEQPVAEQTEAEASTQPAEETPAAQAPVQRPRARPPVQEPPQPSLMERIGQFWWVLVVLGLLLVIGLVLTVIRRRREESAAASLDSLSSLNFEPRSERATPSFGTAAAKASTQPESFLDAEDEEEEAGFDEPPAPVRRPEPAPAPRAEPAPAPAAAAPKASDDTLSSETAVRFDQQDALAEADFHMAYGLYDQAADLVKIAIEREPARRDLKLKLLEIYFVWGNKDLFLETARELHSTISDAQAGEWDKVLIMGRQIAPEDPLFQAQAGPAHVDLVDVNLEGGENRVDVDLFAEPEADKPAGLDLNLATGEHPAASGASDSDLDFLLDEPRRGADEEPTREMDQLARTQETPTIETPMIDRTSQTIREQVDRSALQKVSGDQTAELALDDLGLDVDSLESTGSLEDTTSLKKDDDTGSHGREIGDDEMTQLAPSLGSFDRPKPATSSASPEPIDIESTGTIYLDQVDLAGGDTVEQPRPDVESTASLRGPAQASDLDLNFDQLSGGNGAGNGSEFGADAFSSEVFADRTAEVPRVDLDVGEPLGGDDQEPTNRQQTVETEMELSELEPVTLSEVGTKLDLARAYMDMGDPEGARSILEEVLAEGNASQKQEAQRLIESIR
ncbi:MAG TPA: FimV/HubP family polar landmark protein [Steroidobacter sp.]